MCRAAIAFAATFSAVTARAASLSAVTAPALIFSAVIAPAAMCRAAIAFAATLSAVTALTARLFAVIEPSTISSPTAMGRTDTSAKVQSVVLTALPWMMSRRKQYPSGTVSTQVMRCHVVLGVMLSPAMRGVPTYVACGATALARPVIKACAVSVSAEARTHADARYCPGVTGISHAGPSALKVTSAAVPAGRTRHVGPVRPPVVRSSHPACRAQAPEVANCGSATRFTAEPTTSLSAVRTL